MRLLAGFAQSVIWELNSKDYAALYDTLVTAVDYCWPLESIWIIETPLKPSEVIKVLMDARILDDNDGVIVLEITGVGAFRRVINERTANWLDSHLTRR
jgi:hypothetical protein